ncbi:MAG: hypothetical protein D3916_17245, partial [Candidatus Electrothrix sp. MAN1_4]|nr:hypothetical protein [Candidatus Electrothrix sp. MAN1_4]
APALFSGIRGEAITPGLDLATHFAEQVVSPVDFIALIEHMQSKCDLLVEVGPGRVLSGLAEAINGKKGPLCFPIETQAGQDKDLNLLLAVSFVHGGDINWQELYADRLVRPFVPAAKRSFLTNPCERPFPEQGGESDSTAQVATPHTSTSTGQETATLAEAAGLSPKALQRYLSARKKFLAGIIKVDLDTMVANDKPGDRLKETEVPSRHSETQPPKTERNRENRENAANSKIQARSPIDLLFILIEQQTGFPRDSLSPDSRLLDDLNLDSIKAAELIVEVANKSGVAATHLNAAEYSNAKISEIAEVLARQHSQDDTSAEETLSSKYPLWVRDFTIVYPPTPLPDNAVGTESKAEQQEQILILSETAEQELANGIVKYYADAAAEIALFEDVRKKETAYLNRFSIVIALLPRDSIKRTTETSAATEHTVRLHTIFSK